jgi:predicted ATPase
VDIQNINGYTLNNLSKINKILGKNGPGKSKMLREIERGLASQSGTYGKSKYITPERGGNLVYASNIDDNISNNVTWLSDNRRSNQSNMFRQQSVSQYAKLEIMVLENSSLLK